MALRSVGVNGPRSMSLTIGPAGAGSHFHAHQDAYCVLVHGLKYWALLDRNFTRPRHLTEGLGPQDFLRGLRRDRGEEWWRGRVRGQLECAQGPGEFLFVPSSYRHLVVNLWPSVAVNTEASNPNPDANANPNPDPTPP